MKRTRRRRRDIATHYNRMFSWKAAEFLKRETLRYPAWYYLKDGHRWVVDFLDGKVSKVRVY
ncbi:MAG: hypothetical protein ACRD22_18420 [Terriglobia bacterium]